MTKHTLFIVGSGIKFISHMTTEVKTCIEKSEKVLYLVNEPAMQEWIRRSNTNSESLDDLYTQSELRDTNYHLIASYVVENLKKYKTVCFVIYGHPTLLAKPSMYAANLATNQNYEVLILPAISTIDCLFADLGVHPGSCGWQSYEATDFLIFKRRYDTSSHLILWQAGIIGNLKNPMHHNPKKGLIILSTYLKLKYSSKHSIYIYEAAQYPGFKPKIEKCSLEDLQFAEVGTISTLYLPPKTKRKPDLDIINKIKEITD